MEASSKLESGMGEQLESVQQQLMYALEANSGLHVSMHACCSSRRLLLCAACQ